MAPQKNASQAEIWDDSLLVNSWSEAVEEYKRYHSIHARGEKIEDVLSAAGKDADEVIEGTHREDGEIKDQTDEKLTHEAPKHDMPKGIPTSTQSSQGLKVSQPSGSTPVSGTAPPSAPAFPPHLIGQVQDEGLKNLLMSWYYAGYYTGLYEGQHQGQGM